MSGAPEAQRRRKTAAERRAQRQRAEGRAAMRLLKAFDAVATHRGQRLTGLAEALRAALAGPSEGAEQASTAPVEVGLQMGEPTAEGAGAGTAAGRARPAAPAPAPAAPPGPGGDAAAGAGSPHGRPPLGRVAEAGLSAAAAAAATADGPGAGAGSPPGRPPSGGSQRRAPRPLVPLPPPLTGRARVLTPRPARGPRPAWLRQRGRSVPGATPPSVAGPAHRRSQPGPPGRRREGRVRPRTPPWRRSAGPRGTERLGRPAIQLVLSMSLKHTSTCIMAQTRHPTPKSLHMCFMPLRVPIIRRSRRGLWAGGVTPAPPQRAILACQARAGMLAYGRSVSSRASRPRLRLLSARFCPAHSGLVASSCRAFGRQVWAF